MYISNVLWSTDGGFHHFKRLSRKSKKMKTFMTADLRNMIIFGHFTCLHISHPHKLIFTFQVSCGQLVVLFIILKGFPESRKKMKFFMTADLRKKNGEEPNKQIASVPIL